MKTQVTPQEHSEVLISVTFEPKELEIYRDVVTEEALASVQIDGFRKGKAPKDIALKQLNPLRILEEMAHRTISARYADILKETKVKSIGFPEVTITKIAEGSPLEVTLKTAVVPEITLGNYKKIAAEVNKEEADTKVTQEELDEAIMNLRKMRAQQEQAERAKDAGKEQGSVPSWNDMKEEDLPPIDDAWAQALGPFEGLSDFTDKMEKNLQEEKAAKALEKKRISIVDRILETATIAVPKMMVEYEVDKMLHEFEHNIAMTGMTFDDYLTSINKTRDDYKEAWKEQGIKRAQTQLMLSHIAKEEKIEASDTEIEEEVTKIMEQYKNQPGIDESAVRSYVTSVLSNQKVFEFLEKSK